MGNMEIQMKPTDEGDQACASRQDLEEVQVGDTMEKRQAVHGEIQLSTL